MAETAAQRHPDAQLREMEMALEQQRRLTAEKRAIEQSYGELKRRQSAAQADLSACRISRMDFKRQQADIERERAAAAARKVVVENELAHIKGWIAANRERVPTGSTSALMAVRRRLQDPRAWATPEAVQRSRSDLLDVVTIALSQGGASG